VSVPQEVREAQELVENRDRIRLETEEESRLTIARAEEEVARRVDEHELTEAARERALLIAGEAEARRRARFFTIGHTAAGSPPMPTEQSLGHPLTLDLRRARPLDKKSAKATKKGTAQGIIKGIVKGTAKGIAKGTGKGTTKPTTKRRGTRR